MFINTTGSVTLEQSYKVVKSGGRICSIHSVSAKEKAFELGIDAIYSLGDLSPATLNSIIDLYSTRKLKVSVSNLYHFTLEDIKTAHLDFEKGPNQGKRIITFDVEKIRFPAIMDCYHKSGNL